MGGWYDVAFPAMLEEQCYEDIVPHWPPDMIEARGLSGINLNFMLPIAYT